MTRPSREPDTRRRVLIAGGGIGGLTAALCVAQRGLDAVLFERSADFAAAGAGIQLSPNATRVLHRLGLAEALAERGSQPQAIEARHWRSGRVVAAAPLGDSARRRYGFPYRHVHRGDLVDLLAAAARRSARVEVRTGAEVTAFEQDDAGVTVAIAGDSCSGDALIGADGIRSTVRTALFGAEAPTFTGNVAWRALVAADRLPPRLARPAATVWWGPGKHFVHYPVRGGALVNCVCVVETGKRASWQVESWTEPGERDELEADFAGWHDDVGALIGNADADSLYKWALHDRPPLPRWSVGRTTLLGDACHPMLPFLAQGAAMAIEDAAVLAGCLAADNVPACLARYDALRRGRTTRVRNASRRQAKVYHYAGAMAWLRDRAAPFAIGRVAHGLHRYDAIAVADRAAAGEQRP